jgi:HD-like signal output (HDOD) protein
VTGGDPRSKAIADEALDRALVELVSQRAVPIPPYPAVALRVREVVRRNDFGLAEVAHLVGSDGALAADVLRCANSALYRRGPPVTELTRAITRVGAKEVMRLALTSGLAAHAQAPGPLAALKRILWIESLASAVLCQELARLRGLKQEEAYVLGLLHDFGKVVACSCIEATLEKGRPAAARPLAAWSEVVERHAPVVGREVAERWGLPPLVRDVVSGRHAEAASQDARLVEAVKVSDRIRARLGPTLDVARHGLASVASLSPHEREPMARIVEKIPGFIAAFEAPEQRPEAARSLVATPSALRGPGERAAGFGVTITMARRAHKYTAAAIGADRLAVVGKDPLPESRLLEAEIRCSGRSLQLWVLTRSSAPSGEGFRIEVQPYALSSEARSAWNELVAEAGGGD